MGKLFTSLLLLTGALLIGGFVFLASTDVAYDQTIREVRFDNDRFFDVQ